MAQKDGFIHSSEDSKELADSKEKTNRRKFDIKPPIDLISDEYYRNDNGSILVEIICAENNEDAIEFGDFLTALGYAVNKTNINDQNEMYDKINKDWLLNVQKKIIDSRYDGMIIICSKVYYADAELKDIWGRFTATECPNLKNKPKIFIFQLSEKVLRLRRDSRPSMIANWKLEYQAPPEADILVVQDKFKDPEQNILKHLRINIDKYGDDEDIFTLISLSGSYAFYQPLMISTMTQKFYFKTVANGKRGYHLKSMKKHDDIQKDLEKLEKHFEKKPNLKNRPSVFQSVKKSLSLKKKNRSDENNTSSKIDKEENSSKFKSSTEESSNSEKPKFLKSTKSKKPNWKY